MSLENIEDIYELSPAQLGMVFHTLFSPKSGVYTEQIVYVLRGELKVKAFERAWQAAAERHPILRTSIVVEDLDKPFQLVHRKVQLTLEQHDWVELSPVEQEQRLKSLLDAERERDFALSQAPLVRLSVIRRAEDLHYFVCQYHHAILDGWSYRLLLSEVFRLYEGYLENRQVDIGPCRDYGDFIEWLRGQDLVEAEKYWRRELKGITAPNILGIDNRPGNVIDGKQEYDELSFQWSGEKIAALRSFTRQNHLTLNTVVQGIWAILLACYSGTRDVIFGTIVSGRSGDLPGINSMIGLFINTLPVRVKVPGKDYAVSWLKSLQRQLVELRKFEYSPLISVHGWSEVPREHPLFESIVVLENYPLESLATGNKHLTIDDVRFSLEKTNYPISLLVTPEDGLSVQIIFDPRRYHHAAIKRMLGKFENILSGIIRNPDRILFELPVLTDAERKQLLIEWNETKRDYPQDESIHELIEGQAERTPEAVAVVFEGQQLTYGELNQRANQLAHHLKKLGVGPDVLVGICVERSLEMVVGLLGILKAGGAYVPLDPAFPKERLAFMVEDAQVRVLVTQKQMLGDFPACDAQAICFDSDWSTISQQSEENLFLEIDPNSRAYVIYTSGSTGKPKGVEIPHRAVVNFLLSMREQPGLAEQDVLLAVTTISFDIAGVELYLPLLVGARVVVASREVAVDGALLSRLLDESHATVMQATPATWRMLLEAGWRGSKRLKILCGGEALPRDLAEELLKRGCSLWNMYGPTETTIWSTVQEVESGPGPISIGRPIANTRIYLLDSNRQPVPIGVPGELCIGGAGLARGYLNRRELTAEKFILDPFSEDTQDRIYRTGDLARYLPDGRIECLGRIDSQVKIRGFRIELGEIESALNQHPSVRESVVVVREDNGPDKRLVGYCVTKEKQEITGIELRAYLKGKLPDYMIPPALVLLDSLPLTPNGKLDRSALPAPTIECFERSGDYIAPRNPTEETLARIWSEILKVEKCGIEDDFFRLGGHSLLAASLSARIEHEFGKRLPLATLFRSPTIEALASALNNGRDYFSTAWASLVPIQPKGAAPPLFLVHGAGGNVLLYRSLAEHLAPDYPLYGLQSRGLDGKSAPLTTIEEMAIEYLSEIRTIQRKGPYYLGGYCLGGTVAYEMAQILQYEGEEVALVAMLDTYNLSLASKPRFASFLFQRLRFHLGNFARLCPREMINYVIEKARVAHDGELANLMSSMRGPTKADGASPGVSGVEASIQAVNDHAAGRYLPKPYAGRLTLFKPQSNYKFFPDPNMGWGDLALGGLDIVELSMNPHAMLVEPFVRLLATQLKARMGTVEGADNLLRDVVVTKLAGSPVA